MVTTTLRRVWARLTLRRCASCRVPLVREAAVDRAYCTAACADQGAEWSVW